MVHLLWLTLGIPVLVHLLFRRKARRLPFSSLYFLRLVDQRIARRQRIKNWLLLAVRMAVLGAVIAALARPMLRTSALGGRSVATTAVLLLDNSYSMRAVRGDRSAWEAARGAALAVVGELGKGDAASVVLTGPEPGIREEATTDLTGLRRRLGGMRCGWGGTDIAGALGRASEVLGKATSPRRELFIVTDMQKRGWEGAVREAAKGIGEEVEVFLVDVGGAAGANTAIAAVRPGARLPVRDVPTRLRVTLRNTGGEGMQDTVRLVVEGRRVAERVVSLVPGGARTDLFVWNFEKAGFAGGYFQLEPDVLEADNRRYWALEVHEKVPVLVVNGDPSPAAFNDECFFLMAALRVSTQSGRELSPIEPAMIGWRELGGRELGPFKAVVLANVPKMDEGTAERLRRYVRRGGVLMIFGGPKVDVPLYNTWLWGKGDEEALLPARLAGVVTVAARGEGGRAYETVMTLESGHAALREIADGLDVGGARVKAYLEAASGGPGRAAESTVLARLSSGAPLLMEKPMGSGVVFLWTTSADLDWGNLPLKPFFLPVVHQLLYWASRAGVEAESVPVGRVKVLTVPGAGEGAVVQVARVAGPEDAAAGEAGEPAALSAKEGAVRFGGTGVPGLYEARWEGAAGTGRTVFAVNVEPEESDLARLEPAEAVAALGRAVRVVPKAEAVTEAIRVEREGLPLWDYLFAAALCLAVLESFVANRWIRA
jgi:hypothetical protein